MASKKNVFLSGIICLFASASFAQVQTGYDVKDFFSDTGLQATAAQ